MDQEKQLIKNFLEDRSEKKFLLLYRMHADDLLRTSMYLTRYNKEFAEEILQETWITAIRKLNVFEARSSLKTWLTGILINKYKEQIKRRKPVYGDKTTVSMNEIRPKNDLIMDLKKAILQLPDGYREILTLYDIQGFKHREIGEMLGIEKGTSKSQLAQARKRMRSLLQNYR